MIIQCKQCRTKFRFEEAQMQGDGLWMRCSRCQHVFFQDNPLNVMAGSSLISLDVVEDATPEKTDSRLTFQPEEVPLGANKPDEDMDSFLHEVMIPEKDADDDVKPEFGPTDRGNMSLRDIENSPDAENADETDETREALEEEQAPQAPKKSGLWKALLWTVLVVIVIPAIVYFVIFPELGERYVQIVRKYFGVSQSTEGQVVTGYVKLQDIRQRIINNYVLGNIRIVEGTAVNQADFAIARILIKGEILDAYAVVLGERACYAGNVLTDDQLTTLTEEEILKRLAMPEGRNNSNERLIPNGRIPFMIVFTREPPGSIKTTVMIAGAERLL